MARPLTRRPAARPGATARLLPARRTVTRFTATERVYHWVQAVPVMVLMASGGLLWWQRWSGSVWVPAAWLVRVHLIAAVALPIGLLLVFVGGDTRRLLTNARIALTWRVVDLRWLLVTPLRRLRPSLVLPPSGRFNPGQKINLLAQLVLLPLFMLTGLVMWRGGGVLLAWELHLAAFLIYVPLLAGHLFLATIHPHTRRGLNGVFGGEVDAGWAREHYALEYPPPEDDAR